MRPAPFPSPGGKKVRQLAGTELRPLTPDLHLYQFSAEWQAGPGLSTHGFFLFVCFLIFWFRFFGFLLLLLFCFLFLFFLNLSCYHVSLNNCGMCVQGLFTHFMYCVGITPQTVPHAPLHFQPSGCLTNSVVERNGLALAGHGVVSHFLMAMGVWSICQ